MPHFTVLWTYALVHPRREMCPEDGMLKSWWDGTMASDLKPIQIQHPSTKRSSSARQIIRETTVAKGASEKSSSSPPQEERGGDRRPFSHLAFPFFSNFQTRSKGPTPDLGHSMEPLVSERTGWRRDARDRTH